MHTPAPWNAQSAEFANDFMIAHYKPGPINRDNPMRLIARVMSRKDSIDTDSENAALVCAAPDLLRQCQDAANWLKEAADYIACVDGRPDPDEGDRLARRLRLLEEDIRKTVGKAKELDDHRFHVS